MTSDEPFDEASATGRVWTDTIYPTEFRNGAGKFFNIVTEEDGTPSAVEYHPPFPSRNRIKLTVSFIRESGNIKEVTLKKFMERTTKGVPRWEAVHGEPMTFSHFTFEKLLAFLKLLTELDLANLNKRRIALREDTGQRFDAETTEKFKALLMLEDGQQIVDELIRSGKITSRDIIHIGHRKEQLAVFETLMRNEEAVTEYRAKFNVAGTGTEKVWQHFLRTNDWIFGYGLDYQFKGILQSEGHVGNKDVAGRDGEIVDFVVGTKNFTVLVELKTPSTALFEKSKNRSNSWELSGAFLGAVSQILEYKASWQVKAETAAAANFTDAETLIQQRTLDPKCVLIVGRDSAFDGGDKEQAIKRRTFELFRRDSRNIEIITYDELLERARFIVGHEQAKQGSRK